MAHPVYNRTFFEDEGATAKTSSQIVLPYILDKLQPNTIVDFGCGTGEWLYVAKQYDCVKKVVGVDGDYAKDVTVLDPGEFIAKDLNGAINLNQQFDLAISLEVAEHIIQDCAKIFIENLTRHSDIILFSAAIPYQEGKHHVNEQYPSYWQKIFKSYGYTVCDCIRNVFWNNDDVEIWYRQNIMFYCKEELKDELQKKFDSDEQIIDMIHPGYWEYFRHK